MHELGIIVHVAKTLEEVAAENDVTKIGAVTLEIGEVSGIVPEYLTDCWEYYRKKMPLIEESVMKIDMLPAVTYCTACEAEYETVKYGKNARTAEAMRRICYVETNVTSKKLRRAK